MVTLDNNPPKHITQTRTDQCKEKLQLCTYNVRTLGSPKKLLELKYCLRNIQYDIIGLSEIRRQGNGILEDGEQMYYATKESPLDSTDLVF